MQPFFYKSFGKERLVQNETTFKVYCSNEMLNVALISKLHTIAKQSALMWYILFLYLLIVLHDCYK